MSLIARRHCLSATLKRAATPSFGSVSVFSTHTHSSKDNPGTAGTKRLSLSLYRQLLQWCDATDPQVPLSSYFPPVSLSPPYVDAKQLERLFAASRQTSAIHTTTQFHRILEWLPQSKLKADEWTTSIRFANDIRNLIRAVYRINSSSNTDTDDRKLQLSFAFETLRSLNQHTEALLDLQHQQSQHSNPRQDVPYKVGQVVQHKQQKWRAVIVEWNTHKQQPQNNTSLTTKDYTDTLTHVVKYTVFMDTGDVHLLGKGLSTNIISDTHHSSYTTTTALAHELQPLTNPRLCRIRNRDIARHFDRYDSWSNSFVPNSITRYKYPLDYDTYDHPSKNKQTLPTIRYQQGRELTHHMTLEEYDSIARDIVNDIHYVAQQLQDSIAQEFKQHVGNLPPLDAFTLLTDFQRRLASLTDEASQQEHLPVPKAALCLRQLLKISYSVSEALARRQLPDQVRARIRFQVGDIVRHTQYNFRGVVVAWDEQPTVDVTYWDGLEHIPDASTRPFYHVVPVQTDCIRAFGGERPLRYVCQDNLELCPAERRRIDVELESGWQRDPSGERFLAPQAIQFGYGLDIGDRGITEACLTLVQNEFAKLFVSARDVVPSDTCSADRTAHDTESEPRLSFNKLFCLLKVCHSVDHAMVIQETLKDMWKAHTSPEIRREFETGMACLLRGNQQEQALSIFRNVLEQDASYAEAWNKVSICEYMLGNMPASLKAAKRVLELQPRHFQALNGIGLVYWEGKNYDLAVESFAKSLDLDPWSPVSSRFASCLDIAETKKALASDEEASDTEKASAPEWSFSKSPNVESEK